MNTNNLLLLLLTILVLSCHKDESIMNEKIISTTSPLIIEQVNGSIIGYVSDENNNPIKDALVKVYASSTNTNEFGIFEFNDIPLDKQGTFIRVFKEDYIDGSDKVFPLESTVFSSIKMIRLEMGKSFDSASGGEIEITGGGTVTFPPDGIAKENGDPYTGIVNVTARLLNPNSPDLLDLMPGSLEGIASNQHNVVLATAGMIAVELRDLQGRKLNMKEGSRAALEIPALVDTPPLTIPMWYFDMEKGLWIEEGSAILDGGFYKTEVSHFSFWNCDVPFPLINVSGKVLYTDGTPIQFQWVCVETTQGGLVTSSVGHTDANGCFSGKMPKDQELEFSVKIAGCNGELFKETLGPFSQNVVLDPFIISSSLLTQVFGTVTCNGEPYPNSFVVLQHDNETLFQLPNQDANFNFLECFPEGEQVEIFAFSLEDNRSSDVIEITGNSPDNINLELCEEACDFDVEFEYDCINHLLTIEIIGGIPDYEISWDDGRTETSIIIDEDEFNTVKCVEVEIPAMGCLETFCFQIPSANPVSLNYECHDGIICANPRPNDNTYEWSNFSTSSCIFPETPGLYSLTVTDPAGCQVVTSIEIEEIVGHFYIMENIEACNKDLYSISTSGFGEGVLFTSSQGTIVVQYPLFDLSVFNTGFDATLEIISPQGSCFLIQDLIMPHLQDGLIIDNIQSTSCPTCDDGRIEASILPGGNCSGCVIGDIIVVDVALPHNDRTAENNSGSLPVGSYYVVVTDANTGCYIAFEKVEVESE